MPLEDFEARRDQAFWRRLRELLPVWDATASPSSTARTGRGVKPTASTLVCAGCGWVAPSPEEMRYPFRCPQGRARRHRPRRHAEAGLVPRRVPAGRRPQSVHPPPRDVPRLARGAAPRPDRRGVRGPGAAARRRRRRGGRARLPHHAVRPARRAERAARASTRAAACG